MISYAYITRLLWVCAFTCVCACACVSGYRREGVCATVFWRCKSACVYVCVMDCVIVHFILYIFENISSNFEYYIHLDNC